MRRRTGLIIGLMIFALLAAAGAYAYHELQRVLILRIATGPGDGFGAKFAVSIVHLVALEHPRVRVRTIAKASDAEALKALADGEVDLAIARSDAAGPIGQTVAVLRHDAALFIVPHASKVDSVAALPASAPIGIVGTSEADKRLLDAVNAAYGRKSTVEPILLQPGDVTAALRERKVQAVFVVDAAGGRLIAQTLAAFRAAGGAPHLILVDEADAMVKRNHLLESVDLPKGILQGQPPLPDDDGSTIGISTRLFATSALPNAVAAELTRMLLADKPRVASILPPTAVIEAPDTDKINASLPVHAGTAAYLSGNQPSLSDQAQNLLYWAGIIGSLFASIVAAIAALVERFSPKKAAASVKLLDLWEGVSTADGEGLDAIEKQVDLILHETVLQQARGKGDEISPAFPLLLSQVRRSIDRRRTELAVGKLGSRPRPEAAEVAAS